MKQNGYIVIDLMWVFIPGIIVGFILGLLCSPMMQFVWKFLKPLIHEMTK